MRLDSLGKPPILQVVPEPKKTQGIDGDILKATEVKRVSDAPGGSVSSQGQEKLGQIIEILARAKKENSKKKKKNSTVASLIIQEYKRVENYYQQEWHMGQKQRGEKIDIQG